MRAIEAEINKRRGEPDRRSDIPLTNFRGIELRDFPAEIARLALIIAEYQCDVLYRGQKEALAEFLPLDSQNWITCGNALRLDWLSICPPTGTCVKVQSNDLFATPLDQAEIDFENEGGETYICGNPPYKGSKWQSDEQKSDLASAWVSAPQLAKTTDFVSGWIGKFLDYAASVPDAIAAFVTTNSICQGQQASDIWPVAFKRDVEICFAHTPFKWSNLASHNAGVTVIIIGLGRTSGKACGPTTAGGRLTSMSFGPVNGEGGERRLNVLFTRARVRCEVFCSFDPGDMDVSRTSGGLGVWQGESRKKDCGRYPNGPVKGADGR